jgi:hypothetical protein
MKILPINEFDKSPLKPDSTVLSFDRFLNEDGSHGKDSIDIIHAAAKKDPSIEWIEPVVKGKLQFDEDKTDDCSLAFDKGEKSIHVLFSWTRDVRRGSPGDHETPPDADEFTLIDIDVKEVTLLTDGAEDELFKTGPVVDAAWLLLYTLLPDQPDRQLRAQAEKLKIKQ